MQKMKRVTSMLLAVCMLLVMAACGSNTDTDTQETEKRNDIVIQHMLEPQTLDIHQASDNGAGFIALQCYATLVELHNGEIVPSLAESWEWNDDMTTVTFKLRDDAKFSDGTDITAEDVKYSFERGIGFGYSPYFAIVASIEAPDDHTVVINLNEPNIVFLNYLTNSVYTVMSKAHVESGADIAKEIAVGSGAYYVTEWDPGVSITLAANPYYYKGVAPIENVKVQYITDSETCLMALESGDVSFITTVATNSIDYVDELDSCYTYVFNSNSWNFLCLNHNVEYFADPNVRLALSYAIGRDDIITVARDGAGIASSDVPVTEGISGYVKGYEAHGRDIEKAKEYLAASAYPDGFSFSVLAATEEWKAAATVMQSQLAEIGIEVIIEEIQPQSLVSSMTSNNYEAGIISAGFSTGDIITAAQFYTEGASLNLSFVSGSDAGNLITKSCAYEGEERLDMLKEAYDIIADSADYLGLWWASNCYGISSDLNYAGDFVPGILCCYNMSWK